MPFWISCSPFSAVPGNPVHFYSFLFNSQFIWITKCIVIRRRRRYVLRMFGQCPGIDAEFTARFRFPIVTRWRMQWRRKFVDRIDGQMRRFPPFHHFRVGTKFCKIKWENDNYFVLFFKGNELFDSGEGQANCPAAIGGVERPAGQSALRSDERSPFAGTVGRRGKWTSNFNNFFFVILLFILFI